jgi:plasmid stability protein
MATLTVRDIDDADYEALQMIARKNNRSTAAQVRDMIAELGRKQIDADQAVADLLDFRKKYPIKPRTGQDAVSMIRAVRDK